MKRRSRYQPSAEEMANMQTDIDGIYLMDEAKAMDEQKQTAPARAFREAAARLLRTN